MSKWEMCHMCTDTMARTSPGEQRTKTPVRQAPSPLVRLYGGGSSNLEVLVVVYFRDEISSSLELQTRLGDVGLQVPDGTFFLIDVAAELGSLRHVEY